MNRHFLLSVLILSIMAYGKNISHWSYEFQTGCVGSLEETLERIKSRATYHCDREVAASLLSFTLQSRISDGSGRSRVFDARAFLSLLRDRALTVLGDSLAQQLFHAIEIDLAALENTSRSVHLTGRQFGLRFNPVSLLASVRHYTAFNATLKYCKDDLLQEYHKSPLPIVLSRSISKGDVSAHKQQYLYCGKRALSGSDPIPRQSSRSEANLGSRDRKRDILVVAVGAWFKPYFQFAHRNLSYSENLSYYKEALRKKVRAMRITIQHRYAGMHVVWRLHPHAGNIDEANRLSSGTVASHHDGLHWSNTSLEAHWVSEYNQMFRELAYDFKDSLLDWHRLSWLYIDHFSARGVPTHRDSLHWCAEGLPRGGNLLLYNLLEEMIQTAHSP